MSSARPAFYTVVAYVILCIGFFPGVARTQEVRSSAIEDAVMHIEYHQSQLSVRGDASSAAHEAILRQTAIKLFPDDDHDIELNHQTAMPPGWALLSELTLRAISETSAATGIIGTNKVFIHGITMDLASWQQAAVRVEENLLPGMQFATDVIEIRPTTSMQYQCRSLFHSALRAQTIEFSHGSDQLNSNTFALLDELIQISADCPGASIAATGHTDNTGNEAGNQQLSEARARSVVAYMVASGIAADRLSATGAGSTDPLLDEDSSRARRLNRRIELEFSYP